MLLARSLAGCRPRDLPPICRRAGIGLIGRFHVRAGAAGDGTWVSDDLLSKIKDRGLVKTQGLVGGEWVGASDGSTFDVGSQSLDFQPCMLRRRCLYPHSRGFLDSESAMQSCCLAGLLRLGRA